MPDIILPEYKIWEYASSPQPLSSDPRGLDYVRGLTTGVHTYQKYVKGEKIAEEVYVNYDGETYSDLLVSVSIEYYRADDGTLKSKTKTYKWALIGTDDLGDIEKVSRTVYSVTEAAVADQRRRSNIVDNLVAKADPAVASFVKTMFRNLDNEINSYKSTGDTSLIHKISTYTGAWLDVIAIPASIAGVDVTLRQAIIGQLTL